LTHSLNFSFDSPVSKEHGAPYVAVDTQGTRPGRPADTRRRPGVRPSSAPGGVVGHSGPAPPSGRTAEEARRARRITGTLPRYPPGEKSGPMGSRAVQRPLQGGPVSLFGKVFGGIVGKVVKTVVGSTPILGGVVSAVGAVKSALHPPTLANTANLSARTGVAGFGQPPFPEMLSPSRRSRSTRSHPPGHSRRKKARTRTRATRTRTRTHAKKAGRGHVSAKQRAARARFARAAKRGRIKKGSRLS